MLIHTSKLRFEGGKRRDGSEEMRREEGRVLHEQSMIMMIGLAFLLNHEIDWRYNLGFATRKYRKSLLFWFIRLEPREQQQTSASGGRETEDDNTRHIIQCNIYLI